jgi:condensation domain-containing protein
MTPPASETSEPRIFPATFEQEAVWLDECVNGAPLRYAECWIYRLRGSVDLEAVEWALSRIVHRHAALRTELVIDEESLNQVVAPARDVKLTRLSLSAERLEDALVRMIGTPVDLVKSPFKAAMFEVSADDFVLALIFHHAAIDDWSLTVFAHEFSEFYRARLEGRSAVLEELPIDVGEYALKQRASKARGKDLSYWRANLTDVPSANGAPPDCARDDDPSHACSQACFGISASQASRIRRICRGWRVTPFDLFAAVLSSVLCAYLPSDDLILCTPMSRRGSAEVEQMIGCLTRLVPLRIRMNPEDHFAEVVSSVKKTVLDAMIHDSVPYATLAAMARSKRSGSATPLHQTSLIVGDARQELLDLPGIAAERIYITPLMAKCDLSMTLVAGDEGYRGFLDYSRDIYDVSTGERIVRDFQAILGKALENEDLTCLAISNHIHEEVSNPR